jgi:hypothetical protein
MVLERALAEQHLIEAHSQRPNVCRKTVRLTFQDLRGHVDWGPDHRLREILHNNHIRTIVPERVLQKPKSAILIIPSCSKMFDGFKSRCRIFSRTSV